MREQYAKQLLETIKMLQKLREYSEYYHDVNAALPRLEQIWINLSRVTD